MRALRSGNFDVIATLVQVWPPAIVALNWQSDSPYNLTHYSNAALDAAIAEGDFDRVQSALADDPPMLEVCRQARVAAIDSRVLNPDLGPYDLLESLPDWEVAP